MIAAAQLEILQETILTKEITLTRCASSQNVMSAVRSTAITNYNSHTYTSRMFILDQLTSSMFHEEYWSTATNKTYWNTATNDDTSRAEFRNRNVHSGVYIDTKYRIPNSDKYCNEQRVLRHSHERQNVQNRVRNRTATGSVATECSNERTMQHISRLPDHE